jgi:(S)-ureidoglycine aminohydrolase
MKTLLLGLIFNLTFVCGYSENDKPFKSQVFHWEKTKVAWTRNGENRQFMKGFTNHLDYIDIHATTLNPGKEAPATDIRPKFEKLLIVKEGQILQTINGEKKTLNPGSVVLAGADDILKIENAGDKPVVYFMIQWKNSEQKQTEKLTGEDKVKIIEWENVPFVPTEKGGTRRFFKRPTDCLFEFEMHVTTLNEGVKSHDPHIHPDDEIILMKSGMAEELINGKPYQLGPGSFVLLNGNDPHGIRNIGKGACEYFAFRFLRNQPATR